MPVGSQRAMENQNWSVFNIIISGNATIISYKHFKIVLIKK